MLSPSRKAINNSNIKNENKEAVEDSFLSVFSLKLTAMEDALMCWHFTKKRKIFICLHFSIN